MLFLIKRECDYESGKQRAISSVDIKTLEEKVKARGFEWRKL